MNLNLRKRAQTDRDPPPRYVIEFFFPVPIGRGIIDRLKELGSDYGGQWLSTSGYSLRMYFYDEDSTKIAAEVMCTEARHEGASGSYEIYSEEFDIEAQQYVDTIMESAQFVPVGYSPDVDYEP